jgi:hypothetical protein
MLVTQEVRDLERLDTERVFTCGYPPEVVRAFRMRMQQFRAFTCIEDIQNSKALDARPKRSQRQSIRLVDGWHLRVEVLRKSDSVRVRVLGIEQTDQKVRRLK